MASFSDPPATTAPSLTAIRLRARARELATRLAQPRYLAAAAAAAPLIGLAFLRFGAGAEFAVAAFVIPTLCLLAAIDFTERRIPNRIVLPATAVVLVAQTMLFPERALEWFLAAGAAALVLLLPLLVYPAGVGMGDVKLMLLLGAALGTGVAAALVIGSLAAAVYAVFLLVRSGGDARQSSFPLGPFLAVGAIIALLA
jgi:prepilin signal peptidase PulO-like enzyme (type II secretory pathway)